MQILNGMRVTVYIIIYSFKQLMFEFPANYLFITAAIAEDDRFDVNSGLVGDNGGSTYMMMRERNSTSFKMNTGLGFEARWSTRSGRSYYGMGRVIGNTF